MSSKRCEAAILTVLMLSTTGRGADFPGKTWAPVATPESVGYSSAKLEVLRAWLKTQNTTAMMVSVGGRVLLEYGDLKRVSAVASVRKSILGMLYGKYIVDGTIDLKKSVKEVGLDDVQKFLPVEEKATLEHLLMSRSGIYHPAGTPDPPEEMCPVRGSQIPGTFYCYNNWDFDAAGTAFEKLTGKNIYDALETNLARPTGMQDFDRALQKKDSMLPYSVHPEYHMYLSTRDMARLGLLMLRQGNWEGKELIDERWVKYMTTLVTPVSGLFPQGLRVESEMGPMRWGYGVMWWVWDTPRLPSFMSYGDFYGSYAANGWGGQFIAVLPARDLVVAHKVDISPERAKELKGYVSTDEFQTMLQMLVGAYCGGDCKKPE